jgi:AcrR family transcriptional regulator
MSLVLIDVRFCGKDGTFRAALLSRVLARCSYGSTVDAGRPNELGTSANDVGYVLTVPLAAAEEDNALPTPLAVGSPRRGTPPKRHHPEPEYGAVSNSPHDRQVAAESRGATAARHQRTKGRHEMTSPPARDLAGLGMRNALCALPNSRRKSSAAESDWGPIHYGHANSAEMSVVDHTRELPVSTPRERGDAARNRALLLDAARQLIAEHGADAVTMDDLAAAAGVGKGTVFRRFGSRAGLMMVLLGEAESRLQQAFMFGPPPLGPDAPPVERLLAFGRERLRFVHAHHTLLSAISRNPQTRYNAAATVLHTHVRMLLAAAGTTGDLDAQTDALLALLDANYVEHQLNHRGKTLATLGDAWESLARRLCGR